MVLFCSEVLIGSQNKSKLSVRWRCSFVSNAFASDPVKSLPIKKSWERAVCTNTLSWYAVLMPFVPSKCRMMSADPLIGCASPVHDMSTICRLGFKISMCPSWTSCSNTECLITVLAHPLSWSALILMHFDSSPMFSGDDNVMSTNARAGFWLMLEVKIFTLLVV